LAEAKAEVPKKPTVRWQPGQSGNPAGKPKGLRNKVSIAKTALELTLRQFSDQYVPHVLAKALEMALNGDRAMIKLILDLHMSKPVHQDEGDTGRTTVQVLVNNLTTKGEESAVGAIKAPPHSPVSIQARVLPLSGNKNGETDSSGDHRNSEEYPEIDSDGSQARLVDGQQQADRRESTDR
jgi:hypothetical protein